MTRMLWLSPVTFMLWPRRSHCVPSTMELGNRTQVWLKTQRKKFHPSPKRPPLSSRLFNSYSHWLQKNSNSVIITCTKNRLLMISPYKQPGRSSISTIFCRRKKEHTVTTLKDWITRDSAFDSRKEEELFSAQSSDWLRGPCSLLTNVSRGGFPRGAKGPINQADHTPPPNDEVKNAWSYNFTSLKSLRRSDWTHGQYKLFMWG